MIGFESSPKALQLSWRETWALNPKLQLVLREVPSDLDDQGTRPHVGKKARGRDG